jgi:hypothetical protein
MAEHADLDDREECSREIGGEIAERHAKDLPPRQRKHRDDAVVCGRSVVP